MCSSVTWHVTDQSNQTTDQVFISASIAYVTSPAFPYYIYGTAQRTHFKFDHQGYYPEMQKLGQVSAWPRSHDLHLHFGIPSLSLQWEKLQTSNVLCTLNISCTNQTSNSCLSLCLSVSLCVCVYVCLSVCVQVLLSLPAALWFCPLLVLVVISLCVCVCVSVSLCVSLSVCLCLCVYVSMSVCLCTGVAVTTCCSVVLSSTRTCRHISAVLFIVSTPTCWPTCSQSTCLHSPAVTSQILTTARHHFHHIFRRLGGLVLSTILDSVVSRRQYVLVW